MCFYSKSKGAINLFFEGEYIGTFKNYFPDESPQCGEEGTINISYKPGTYRFSAETKSVWSNIVWNGVVTIKPGVCQLQGLAKKTK